MSTSGTRRDSQFRHFWLLEGLLVTSLRLSCSHDGTVSRHLVLLCCMLVILCPYCSRTKKKKKTRKNKTDVKLGCLFQTFSSRGCDGETNRQKDGVGQPRHLSVRSNTA